MDSTGKREAHEHQVVPSLLSALPPAVQRLVPSQGDSNECAGLQAMSRNIAALLSATSVQLAWSLRCLLHN
jgi:hypothetical protein